MGTAKNTKDPHKKHILFGALITLLVVVGLVGILWSVSPSLLDPSGVIASKERDLIVFTVLLGSVVVLPVFVMLFVVAWRSREGNTKAKYTPDWQSSRPIEALWWGIPLVIISILGVVAWQTSHELDPFKPLESDKKPVKIQVVALQWRWLFIYPEEKVASVNEVYMPVNRPINFEITADAPMNSFWIPKLGGQVYAMTGMSTKLHLQASEKGEYVGSSANISGRGFAGMRFTAKVVSEDKYLQWNVLAKQVAPALDESVYSELANPSLDRTPHAYALQKDDLYDTIIMKYMGNH